MENPSRDFYFPITIDHIESVLNQLPEKDVSCITHIWLRKPNSKVIQSPNQKVPDRKSKCVIETHLNIKQNVIFSANLKPV